MHVGRLEQVFLRSSAQHRAALVASGSVQLVVLLGTRSGEAVQVVGGVRVVVEVQLLLGGRQVVRGREVRWLEVGRRGREARGRRAGERGAPGAGASGHEGARGGIWGAQARDGAQGCRGCCCGGCVAGDQVTPVLREGGKQSVVMFGGSPIEGLGVTK